MGQNNIISLPLSKKAEGGGGITINWLIVKQSWISMFLTSLSIAMFNLKMKPK